MAVIPNAETELFCTFLQTAYFIRITPAREIVIAEVKAASIAGTSVTDNVWNNFLLSSYQWYQAYLTDKEFNNSIGVNKYALTFMTPSFNPLDATTYYVGAFFNAAPPTSGGIRRMYMPAPGTIKKIYGWFYNTVSGDAATSSMYLRVNNTTDYLISAAVINNALTTTFDGTGLTIPIVEGDYVEIKWVCPTWATTNPTGVFLTGNVYLE